MHQRVIEFRNRLFGYADKGEMPIADLRGELLTLHSVIEDMASREELLRLFHVLSDVLESHLADQPEMLASFKIHRQQQVWLLIRAECLRDGEIDAALLQRVTKREVRAGRMTKDDPLRRYALGDMRGFDAFYGMMEEHEANSAHAAPASTEPNPIPNTPEYVRQVLARSGHQ